MGDPTARSGQSLVHEYRAYAARKGINGAVGRWSGRRWFFASCDIDGRVVAMCNHTHRSEGTAKKCAASLVLAQAANEMRKDRLFS